MYRRKVTFDLGNRTEMKIVLAQGAVTKYYKSNGLNNRH